MCNEYYPNDKLCKCKRIEFNKGYRLRKKKGEPMLKRGRKRVDFFSKDRKNYLIREAETKFNLIYCRSCEELKAVDNMVKNAKVKSGRLRLCKKCKNKKPLWKCYKCGASKPKDMFRNASSLSYKTKIHICTDCPVDTQVREDNKRAFDCDYQFSKYIKGSNYNPYLAKAMGWFLRHNEEFKTCLIGYGQWRWSYIDDSLHPLLKNQPSNVKLEVKTDKWRNLPFMVGDPDLEPNGYTMEQAQQDWVENRK